MAGSTGKDGTDPKERDWDAETTRIKEKEWFRSHPMYQDIPELCGVDRLMGNMVSLLAEKMVNEIPVLVDQMRLRRVKVYTIIFQSFGFSPSYSNYFLDEIRDLKPLILVCI